ncbi:MAG: hypothetical protein MRJ65_05345 [Candidatus Brocadiaceae bacterium]|nr:hypothetical protein [Candidatus Brocadiaceae bacterium]
MLEIVNATTVIAVVTFLWYRRGRLWSFYYSIISQSLQQIEKDSLDRIAWEKIAFENLDSLVKNLFGSLFQFEIEYLRNKIIDNQYLLWICDSSIEGEKVIENNTVKWVEKEITITNKEAFCSHSLKKTFFTDFRFCDLVLFINSIIYIGFERKKIQDTKKEIRKLL